MIKKSLNKLFKSPNIKSKKGKGKKKKITNTMKLLQAIDSRINNIRKNPLVIEDKPPQRNRAIFSDNTTRALIKSDPMEEEKYKEDVIEEFPESELINDEDLTYNYLMQESKHLLDNFIKNKIDKTSKDHFINDLTYIRNKARELYNHDIVDDKLFSILNNYKNSLTWDGGKRKAFISTVDTFLARHHIIKLTPRKK